MSHLHSIAGQMAAADQYQAYMERMRSARLAEEKKDVQKKSRPQAFESFIDPDQDSGADSQKDPGQENEDDPENEGFIARA